MMELRHQHGLNQDHLAMVLGVSREKISEAEMAMLAPWGWHRLDRALWQSLALSNATID
jgi:transcriptional regulator with XRE-family HTH domain